MKGLENMETYEILRDLAIILLSAKLCAMAARKLKFPQVAGQIVAGLLIGPCFLGLVQPSDFITKMAEIGVILVMFSAGLETDLKDLIKTGPKALAIACSGVFIPFVLGALLYIAFYGFEGIGTPGFYTAMSIGAVMTATSVSITVAALQELGRLKRIRRHYHSKRRYYRRCDRHYCLNRCDRIQKSRRKTFHGNREDHSLLYCCHYWRNDRIQIFQVAG